MVKKIPFNYLGNQKLALTYLHDSVSNFRILLIPNKYHEKISRYLPSCVYKHYRQKPFFTTKPSGEGTSLGLSLSSDIVVKGHGGTIDVTSTEGNG